MTLFTGVIGAFEATLFAMFAGALDRLADARLQMFRPEQVGMLALLALVLAGRIATKVEEEPSLRRSSVRRNRASQKHRRECRQQN